MALAACMIAKAGEPEAAAMAADGTKTTAGETTGRFTYGIDYTGELHTDFQGGSNCLNLLYLEGTWQLTRQVQLKLATLSIAKWKESLLDDLQVFSNLEAERMALTLPMAGVQYEWERGNTTHALYAGLRNTGEDYFVSDVTSFFINSSCGIFPTLSANYPIATYPCSAMSLHYGLDTEHWGIRATLYNGVGNYRLTGRDNLWRICPQSDGLLGMAQAEYRQQGSSYFLGGSLQGSTPTFWSYAEQLLAHQGDYSLQLMAAYSLSLDADSPCQRFAGLGFKLNVRSLEFGLFTDYADFSTQHEYATELVCQLPLGRYLYLKPALHYVNGTHSEGVIGMLRFGFQM